MLQSRGGPSGGAVHDGRTAKAEQIEHRAVGRGGAGKAIGLDLPAQCVQLPADDFERVYRNRRGVVTGGGVAQLETGSAVGSGSSRIETEAGSRKRPPGRALREIAVQQEIGTQRPSNRWSSQAAVNQCLSI